MHDHATTAAPSEGRRRADFPAAGQPVAAMTPRDPWDEPRERVSAIPAALDNAGDQLSRLEGILVNLDSRVGDLAEKLGPVLTMGMPAPMPPEDDSAASPAAEDHRSTIAQLISTRAEHAHKLGDYGNRIAARVSAILEHVEA